VFYLTEPPTDWQVPRDWRRLPGEPPRRLTPELIVAVRMAYYRRSIVLELDPDASQSPLVGSTEPATRATDLAARARDILGVTLEAQYGWDAEHDSLNGWMAALEERGVLVFHFTGVAVKEVRGFSLSERVLPVVGINGHDTVNGRIFTLAHELGHLMLGEGGSCDLGDATLPSVSRSETEIYANRFAGALLVPAAALLSDPVVSRAGPGTKWEISEIERLAARFRVSREVILRRLVTLERADADFYRRKRAELLALPPRDTEPSSGGPAFALMVVRNVGKPFARLVLDAYHANSITGPDVSDYLGAGLQHLPAIEARLSSVQALTGGDL
ncbi:MAG: ImmA/IrrE family metallo-endopeptidase, partial [Dehalococcoidia bacterium]